MAKIIITVEDSSANKVRVVATPGFETLMRKHASGNDLSSAEAYALLALRSIREESKKQEPTKILIPRLGRK